MSVAGSFVLLSLILMTCGCAAPQNAAGPACSLPLDRAIICTEQSNEHIVIMAADKDWSTPESTLWAWDPAADPGVKKEHKRWFNNPSECKVVRKGTGVLMTASGGAVALLDIPAGRVLFYAKAPKNPHSAELLPDGNIVSASSTGSALALYCVPEKNLTPGYSGPPHALYPLYDAHGCVWDKTQQLLWAAGGKELAAFEYNFSKKAPALKKKFSFKLDNRSFLKEEELKKIPEKWRFYFAGHDLFPEPGSHNLFLTGNFAILKFDTRSRKFSLFNNHWGWKSISVNPATGELIFQKPVTRWWSEHISQPDGRRRTRPGARFYKGRWFSLNNFSY
ncbi:MAG: hypothetical protein J6S54_06975 [Lentisphaeria bacterium]|nr:hypothetical protein [Lentisphaeria bacterium]